MRTIAIRKMSLQKIDYNNKDNLLLVWVMINVGLDIQRGFIDDNIIYTSLESIWDVIACGECEPSIKQKKSLVDALSCLENEGLITILSKEDNIKYSTKLKIKVTEFEGAYTCIRRDELYKMFTLKFADIETGLRVFFRIVSHASGNLYYKNLTEITDGLTSDICYDADNKKTWFIGTKKEDLIPQIKGLIWFPNKEDIITTRFDSDKVKSDWITRPTLDRVLDELEKIGIISQVKTKEGVFGNKVVFCKSQHVEIVEQFYERVINQKDFSEQVKQEKTIKSKTTMNRRW